MSTRPPNSVRSSLGWLCCLALSACEPGGGAEKWENLMGQTGFALTELVIEPSGQMFARNASGLTLKRRAEWNAWAPLPSYASAEPLLVGPQPRSWDVNGNVYFSNNVIYRLEKGSGEWKLVPGSVGKTLQTVDPQGNVFARGAAGSEVQLAGTDTWGPCPAVNRVDAMGRAYAGNQRLDGAGTTTDELWTQSSLLDAKGDVLEFVAEGTAFRITRRPFGSAEKTELASFTSELRALVLVGCGLEGTCVLFSDPSDVYQVRRGEALRKVASTRTTSTGQDLNFSAFRLFVGPDGKLYLSDVSGNSSLAFSRVVRLKPLSGTWPAEAQP